MKENNMFDAFFKHEALPEKIAHYQRLLEFLVNVNAGLSMYRLSLCDFEEQADSVECAELNSDVVLFIQIIMNKVSVLESEYINHAKKD